MAQQMAMTLHELLLRLFTNARFRQAHPDLKQTLIDHGHGEVTPGELKQAMTLVADELPPVQANQLSSYLNATSGASSSGTFNVSQGGSSAAAASSTGGRTATASSGGTSAPSAAGTSASSGGGTATPGGSVSDQLDVVVQEISYVTNNITETNVTSIDSRATNIDSSVNQSITAGGNVTLDQDISSQVASGDGAVAGNIDGSVNTGENAGIVGDAQGASVTNVEGEGNVTGDIGDAANVATGGVGTFVGGDVSGSAVTGGDNTGTMVGDATGARGSAFGDGNTVIGDAASGNVNVGGSQINVQDSEAVNFGAGDVIQAEDSAINTGGGAQQAAVGGGDAIDADGSTVAAGGSEANIVDIGAGGEFGSGGDSAGMTQVNVGSGDASNQGMIDQSVDIDQSFTDQSVDIDQSFTDQSVDIDQSVVETNLTFEQPAPEPEPTPEPEPEPMFDDGDLGMDIVEG